MMSEEAYFSSAAQRACFDDLGVEQYEIIATMDGHTSDICKSLDGKVFPISDYRVGVTAPPFHVNCRSTTAPHFEGDFEASDGEETVPLPEDMTYDDWKKVFVDDVDESGLTNDGKDDIMKMGKANHIQSAPDFSKYPVVDNEQAVEEFRKQIIADFDLKDSDVNLSGIKNIEVLQPFFARMQKIVRDTGMKMPSIYAAKIIEGDACCIASFKPGENRLYISSQFFNSKAAIEDTLRDWASKGIMPAQCKSVDYIAEREAAHIRIPRELITSKEADKIWKKRKLNNNNDDVVFEYFADIIAIYRMNPNTKDNSILRAVEYLRNGGVSV